MNYRELYPRLLYVANRDNSEAVIEVPGCEQLTDSVKRIILSSSKNLTIVSRNLNSRVFAPELSGHIDDFITSRRGQIDIVLITDSEKEGIEQFREVQFLPSGLRYSKGGQFSFSAYHRNEESLSELSSVVIGDKNKYLSTDSTPLTEFHPGTVCFNDPDFCSEYENKRKEILSRIEPLFVVGSN